MQKLIKIITLLVFITSYWIANARDLTFTEKIREFNQLVTIIKSSYGPIHYKEKNLGISLTHLQATYLLDILDTQSNGEFYYLLTQFVAEFKDSHFGIRIPTTHKADIPIYTDLVDNKAIITYFEKEKLPESLRNIEVGDEIISFNHKPVLSEINHLQKFIGQGYHKTAKRLSTMFLFHRIGTRVPVPPKKTIQIVIKKNPSLEMISGEVEWEQSGISLDEYDSNYPYTKIGEESENEGEGEEEKTLRSSTLAYDQIHLGGDFINSIKEASYESYLCNGKTRITVPDNAVKIIEKPFVAYYHPTAKGNIGYLRIPHYYPLNEVTKEMEYDLWYKKYEYAISILEKNTVGLIIDQDHNCGGSVELLERMVGLFMNKPYSPLMFTLMASKESLFDFTDWEKEISENTIEYSYLENTKKLIKDAWLKGDFMTEKASVWGASELYPNPRAYTKPIIVLIDEMSGSGGDAFPAMMQGFGRAKLLGTRTMGAGGHVTPEAQLNYSQINIFLTKSLFYHPNGTAIENNGTTPDIPYNITINDIKNGFKDYQKFYLNELFKMIE